MLFLSSAAGTIRLWGIGVFFDIDPVLLFGYLYHLFQVVNIHLLLPDNPLQISDALKQIVDFFCAAFFNFHYTNLFFVVTRILVYPTIQIFFV
jgi:hypothetical protein